MAKDLFSKQSQGYARYRPAYPPELFDYILGFVSERKQVWDCATGNGQAAVALADLFEQVMATDSSSKQLEQAIQKENIIYRQCTAEDSGLPAATFNLVTVAQAYHWFRFDLFEKEVRRVAKEDAVVAVWGYDLPSCNNNSLNAIIHDFYNDVVGPYWDPERKYVEACYETVPFNFSLLPSRAFSYSVNWNREDLAGYLRTWSSVQHYIKEKKQDPVEILYPAIQQAWSAESQLSFVFPIFLRIGRV